MTYRDIIQRMKDDGHHYEADALERSVERTGWSGKSVHSRYDARDGLSMMSRAGDMAEQAYRDIRHDAERAEDRRQEEEREQRRQEHEAAQRLEAEVQRQMEQDYYEQQQQAAEMEEGAP